MGLEFWANIAAIISLPISIIALIIGGQSIYKVNKIIDNSQKNEINRTKIKNSKINQNNTRSQFKWQIIVQKIIQLRIVKLIKL